MGVPTGLSTLRHDDVGTQGRRLVGSGHGLHLEDQLSTCRLDGTDFLAADITVLTRCTWATGKEVAVSWVRTEGAGRVFYTNFGKVDSDFTHPTIGTEHLFPGLAWVLGRPGT